MSTEVDRCYNRAHLAAPYCAAAVSLLERFLEAHPDHAFARYRYAQNLVQIGRLSDAKRHICLVRGIPPEKEWLVDLLRSQIEMEKGRYTKGELHFRKAAERNPGSTVPWIYLAVAVAKQERFKDACAVLERGLNAVGDLDEVYLNLGNNRRALGDYTGARQSYILDAMTLLILGGTEFLGRYLVHAAISRGHKITLFNRGRTNAELFPDVEKLRGDRNGDLGALAGRQWDAVIDTCG